MDKDVLTALLSLGSTVFGGSIVAIIAILGRRSDNQNRLKLDDRATLQRFIDKNQKDYAALQVKMESLSAKYTDLLTKSGELTSDAQLLRNELKFTTQLAANQETAMKHQIEDLNTKLAQAVDAARRKELEHQAEKSAWIKERSDLLARVADLEAKIADLINQTKENSKLCP